MTVILGIHGCVGTEGHDASAALVRDGEVIAAVEQERFSRRKHAVGESPVDAAKFCLEHAGISLSQVDALAVGWNEHDGEIYRNDGHPRGSDPLTRSTFPDALYGEPVVPPTYMVKHHLAHIAAGYWLSGYESCACICVDGQGETDSITLARATPDRIEILRAFDRVFSLGMFYEEAASYVGLGYNVPGKLMGLASYGEPNQRRPLIFDAGSGEFVRWPEGLVPGESTTEELFRVHGENFCRNHYPFAAGVADEVMSYVNFAATVQATVDGVVLGLARHLRETTGEERLVLCGGVALNCTTNGMVDEAGLFNEVYIPSAANDASVSLGAALEVNRQIAQGNRCRQLRTAGLGPAISTRQAAEVAQGSGLQVDEMEVNTLAERTAGDLEQGRVLAWCSGRAEFGPRALGGRSLISSPVLRASCRRINQIKGRELWRPLAGSVLAEQYGSLFSDRPSPLHRFMLKASPVRPDWQGRIPAVVHVDGTCRPQSVHRDEDGLYYEIIARFFQRSGIPLIVNTSLNEAGKPLVNSASDAVEMYVRCAEIDALIVNELYITRS